MKKLRLHQAVNRKIKNKLLLLYYCRDFRVKKLTNIITFTVVNYFCMWRNMQQETSSHHIKFTFNDLREYKQLNLKNCGNFCFSLIRKMRTIQCKLINNITIFFLHRVHFNFKISKNHVAFSLLSFLGVTRCPIFLYHISTVQHRFGHHRFRNTWSMERWTTGLKDSNVKLNKSLNIKWKIT
jgi:hypothetical protein